MKYYMYIFLSKRSITPPSVKARGCFVMLSTTFLLTPTIRYNTNTMMITITVENETTDKPESIVFDDHGAEGHDYITLFAGDVGYTVELNELMAALHAYDAKRSAYSNMQENLV